MQEKNTLNKKEALFLVESQPLHLGELISVFLKLKDYDFIYICVSGVPQVMPINMVTASWIFLLDAHKDKTAVFVAPQKFENIVKLPKVLEHCTVLTTSTKIYVHMASSGIKTELVPRATGYWGIFQRTAYRQGRALDYLHTMKKEIER